MCTCYDIISTTACAFEDNIKVTTKLSVQVVEKEPIETSTHANVSCDSLSSEERVRKNR